jgi:glycosyltransferase involved in cell wall biosynthesis
MPDTPKQPILKAVAFYSFHADDALSVLRMYGPARAAGLEVIRGVENGLTRLEAINSADLVIIQRDFCKEYPTYQQIISQAHAQNKPVILDLDDNLFILPEDHPDRLTGYYTDSLLPTFQAVMEADLITVATHPLRDYLLPFNKNIQVIPNYLDDQLWKLSSQPPRQENQEKIIIGYMGGSTHIPDLQIILPALQRLLEKYSDRIQFHFWGIEAPDEVASHSMVDWYPPIFFRYDEFVSAFQEQVADVVLAPLCDNLFNSCKSAIKYLEYAAIGVPGVYSRVAPYVDIIDNSKDGLLATTTDEWFNSVVTLIEEPRLRAQLANNAQEKVYSQWLLSKNVHKRIKIYLDAVQDFQLKGEAPSPFFLFLKSITGQYYENYHRKDSLLKSLKTAVMNRDKEIDSLHQQITNQNDTLNSVNQNLAEKSSYISDLENEILLMTTSQSWRLTRPFRAFKRLLQRFIHA